MENTELFIHLAEISGVFVGFGALIAVRSGGASDMRELAYLRWVVSGAIWVVVLALTPILVSSYGVSGHELWLVCSLLGIVLFFGVFVVNARTPEADVAYSVMSRARRVGEQGANLVLFLPMSVALILVVLGLVPDQEPALYLTAVGLGLFLNALALLELVFSRGAPQPASDPATLRATGGTSR